MEGEVACEGFRHTCRDLGRWRRSLPDRPRRSSACSSLLLYFTCLTRERGGVPAGERRYVCGRGVTCGR